MLQNSSFDMLLQTQNPVATFRGLNKIVKEVSRIISNLMSSSNGRKKICAAIQYGSRMVYSCNIHSNIPEINQKFKSAKDMQKVLISGRIMKEMSKGKKIFKLFKFIQDLHTIFELQRSDKSPLLKLLKIMDSLGSFLFNLLDNFLWGISTGILGNRKYNMRKSDL